MKAKVKVKYATAYLTDEEDKILEDLREQLDVHGIKPSRSEVLKMALRKVGEEMLKATA